MKNQPASNMPTDEQIAISYALIDALERLGKQIDRALDADLDCNFFCNDLSIITPVLRRGADLGVVINTRVKVKTGVEIARSQSVTPDEAHS